MTSSIGLYSSSLLGASNANLIRCAACASVRDLGKRERVRGSRERTSRSCCPVLLPDTATRRRGSRRSLPTPKPVFEDRKGRRSLLGRGGARTREENRRKRRVSASNGNGVQGAGSDRGGGEDSLRLTSPVRGRVLQDQTLGARDPCSSSSSSFRRPNFPRLVCDPCYGGCGDIPDCDGRSIFPLDRSRRVMLVCAGQV